MLYVIPLLVGALTVMGAWASPAGPSQSMAIANRVIALAVIWTAAIVLSRFRGTWLARDRLIARRVVEAHGGQIDTAAAEGGGTVASIDLPNIRQSR